MNLDLKSKEWKEFLISDIFDVYTGAQIPKNKLQTGVLPRITGTDTTNGVFEFYKEADHKNYRTLQNFISVSFLGSVFYHPYKASLDMKIHALKTKYTELNKHLASFFVIAIKRITSRTTYGNQISSTDLPNKRIYLPINQKGEPDFEFMEVFMKQKEQEKLEKYTKYIKKRIQELEDFKEVEPLKSKEWKEFVFNSVFNIYSSSSGIDRNKLINKKGIIPYITRSENNNGYDSFIYEQSEKYKVDNSNVITIGLDTQTVFYQPTKFYTGQNIQILESPKLNKTVAHFILLLIKRQMKKFNWGGNGATLTRLRKSKLLLPINQKGEPDYEYMENYIKQLEYKKLKKYLEFKAS